MAYIDIKNGEIDKKRNKCYNFCMKLKEKVGDIMSQRIFKSENEFKHKFIEYIGFCNSKERLPNIAGFCVYCDINRDTFYAQQDYYSDTFKKINDMLEDEALNNKYINDTLKIFYMKNKCGYKDRQEIDNTTTNKVTIVNSLPKVDENGSDN